MKVLATVLTLTVAALAAPSPPSSRIVGGWDALRGEFPYQVSINYCLLTLCQHICGGAIISPSWIVTAAHCRTESPSIGSFYVIAGILDLSDTNVERQSVRVSSFFIHPDYEGGVNPHDIALFRLTSGLVLSNVVAPIALPAEGVEFSGQTVLSGWGSTGGTIIAQMPERLQQVDIPLVPILNCKTALDDVLSGGDHPLDLDANVCTGPLTGGVSACSGDSGGPLAQNGVHVGIVSWGITPCGTVGAPSVYVKTSHYIYWIESIVDEALTYSSNESNKDLSE